MSAQVITDKDIEQAIEDNNGNEFLLKKEEPILSYNNVDNKLLNLKITIVILLVFGALALLVYFLFDRLYT